MVLRSVNPATELEIARYEEMSSETVASILTATDVAQKNWKNSSIEYRKEKLLSAASILRAQRQKFGEIMTREMGKPISQAIAEVEKSAWVCEYYAENAESFLKDEFIESDASKSFISYQPLGVVLAVMPWNFPFWQVFRFAAPALMAGNGGVLKHASNVQGSALAIEKIFRAAGYPEDLFRTLVIGSGKVEEVIRNPIVKAVSLTGSGPAGAAVASTAGNVIKKVVLELGGNDPYVIFPDADLNNAVNACITGRMLNTGQSCIAAKRFIVVEDVFRNFEKLITDKMTAFQTGDPMLPETTVGPLVDIPARNEIHRQVQSSVEKGAKLLCGGVIPEGTGAFYPPTVLSDVTAGMPAYSEEIFGPVATIIRAKDEEDAIRIANDSVFGLGAAIFTRDVEKGTRIAREQLEAGCCFVNDFVRSDPRLPFGGIKESGFGRELSPLGIREFVNAKTVWVK